MMTVLWYALYTDDTSSFHRRKFSARVLPGTFMTQPSKLSLPVPVGHVQDVATMIIISRLAPT